VRLVQSPQVSNKFSMGLPIEVNRERVRLIVTVTPNAAIDKTYVIEGFTLDRVHRPIDTKSVAGGKGINVSRVLRTLGYDSVATGFAGGRIGESILRALDREGLRHDFVRVADEARLCIAVVDPTTGTQTEVNEHGPVVTEDDVRSLSTKVESLSVDAGMVVLCGSCPPGVPETFYRDVTRSLREKGTEVVLDASGEQLRSAVSEQPFMVKPNLLELGHIVGREITDEREALAAARGLIDNGIKIVAVTMGKRGAILTDGAEAWRSIPPEVRFASAVGSGDAFVAAFLRSFRDGASLSDALRIATGAGAANAATYGAGFCSKESIMEMADATTVEKIAD